jgi:osmoprotectant transport system ATP-binding protein
MLTLEAAQRSGVCAEHVSPLADPVRLDEDLRAAVSTMFAWDVDWLACVDREGRFAGVITQRGIARFLGRNGGVDA